MPNENIIRNLGRVAIAKKGDTVWAQTEKVLRDRLGRKPTNAEINRAMRNKVKVPSGDINKIRPGDRTRIPSTAEAAGKSRSGSTRGTRADGARYRGQAGMSSKSSTTRKAPITTKKAPITTKKAPSTTKKATTVKKTTRRSDGSRTQGGRQMEARKIKITKKKATGLRRDGSRTQGRRGSR